MKRLALASFTTLTGVVAASAVWVACSSSSGGNGGNPADAGHATDAGSADAGGDADLAPSLACTDSLAQVYGDPGSTFASRAKGDIIYCARSADISVADLQARVATDLSGDDAPAQNIGYIGTPLTSGAHVYEILYRTERGDPANSAGYSSAKVLIPDTPRAATLPIIVASHGSRGQAGVCTASQENDAGAAVNGDYDALGLPLVGLGYAVILPDLAGYSNFGAPGNPPSAYADAQDVGKSTLDGARALTKLIPSGLSQKVVMIGHSQGGHTAFSAIGIAPTYAPELQIAAAAAFSPLWLNQATWGAILFEANDYPIATNQGANGVSVWYHYTHSVLLDGPDAGGETFAPAKLAQITNFVNNDCWGEWNDLIAAGTTATDLFSGDFANSVAQPVALGEPCNTLDDGGVDPVCTTWVARYAADRPQLTTKIPFLIEYGGQDETIPPDRMACVRDTLTNDAVNFSLCVHPQYGHEGIVRASASDVAAWIGVQVLGETPVTTPCPGSTLTDDAGMTVPCATPPPN